MRLAGGVEGRQPPGRGASPRAGFRGSLDLDENDNHQARSHHQGNQPVGKRLSRLPNRPPEPHYGTAMPAGGLKDVSPTPAFGTSKQHVGGTAGRPAEFLKSKGISDGTPARAESRSSVTPFPHPRERDVQHGPCLRMHSSRWKMLGFDIS